VTNVVVESEVAGADEKRMMQTEGYGFQLLAVARDRMDHLLYRLADDDGIERLAGVRRLQDRQLESVDLTCTAFHRQEKGVHSGQPLGRFCREPASSTHRQLLMADLIGV